MARNGCPASLIVLLAMFCLPSIAFSQKGADSIDRSLASAYVDRAIALHESGDDQSALELLKEALSLSAQDPDALYLMAKIDSPKLSPDYSLRASKAARLEAALALGGFARFTREDAAFELADCLMLVRDYGKAAQTVGDAFAHPELDARAALVLVKSDFFQKREDRYRGRMADALRRFSDDPRFARFFLEHADSRVSAASDRPILDLIAGRLDSLAAADPEMLVLMVPFTSLKGDRVKLIRRYRSLGKGSLRSLIEALRYGVGEESALYEEFGRRAGSGGSVSWKELREFYDLLNLKRNRTAFLEWLSAFSGAIAEEGSGDGIPESVTRLKDGELESWEYDRDQDMQLEVSMAFQDGLPVSATCLQQGKPIALEYSRYPLIRSATYLTEGGRAKLDFGSGGTALPIVSFQLPFRAEGLLKIRKPLRDESASVPGFDAALPRAISLEETERIAAADGSLPHDRRAVTELSDGMALRYAEYLDGKPTLEREYERGVPSEERFGYNQEGKYWEGRAGYERTQEAPFYRKAWISLDANGNGIAEYRESYYPTLKKLWDYDDDGAYDVAEEERDGLVIDSFASKLNGEFDVRVEMKAGRIIAVRRLGKDYPVRKEGSAEIYWIGIKPFELGSAAPKADGLYFRSGVRYLYYRSGPIAFAEIVP